jgi:hypothetical protein
MDNRKASSCVQKRGTEQHAHMRLSYQDHEGGGGFMQIRRPLDISLSWDKTGSVISQIRPPCRCSLRFVRKTTQCWLLNIAVTCLTISEPSTNPYGEHIVISGIYGTCKTLISQALSTETFQSKGHLLPWAQGAQRMDLMRTRRQLAQQIVSKLHNSSNSCSKSTSVDWKQSKSLASGLKQPGTFVNHRVFAQTQDCGHRSEWTGLHEVRVALLCHAVLRR